MLFTIPGRRVLIVLFLAIIWLPLVVMLATPRQEVSEFENRRLAEAPELDLGSPHELAGDFERYFNDHFGFRQTLIYWFRLLEVKVFRSPRAGGVILGDDGWLFQAGSEQVADIRNNWPFRPAELAEWAQLLTEKHEALRERGIEYLFVFTPNKHLIYPEKLPAAVNRVRETSRADQLIRYLDQHTDVPILDLRPALFAAKERLRPYHRTDTHWNDWGAYVGYRTLIEKLEGRIPGLRAVELGPDDFQRRRTPGWDLARALSMQEVLPEIDIHPAGWRPECAVYEGLPQNFTDVDRNNEKFSTRCESGRGRLLMFRDSYSLAMMPYLSETFEYIHYFPASPVPLDGMLRVVDEEKPDIVIEQRSTRWLRKPYG
jgi:alginate O-acetyltransferase complex protein AlgJ